MGHPYAGFDPDMFKCCITSGATTGATFAVADADGTAIAATDYVYEVHVHDGATGVHKSSIDRTDLVISAGAAKTSTVATNADTVTVRWISRASG